MCLFVCLVGWQSFEVCWLLHDVVWCMLRVVCCVTLIDVAHWLFIAAVCVDGFVVVYCVLCGVWRVC